MRKKHSNSIRKSVKRHSRFKTAEAAKPTMVQESFVRGSGLIPRSCSSVVGVLCVTVCLAAPCQSSLKFCRRRFTVRVCPAGRRSAHQRWQLYQYGELDDVTSTYFVLTHALRYPAVLSVLSYFFFLM